MMMMMGRFFDAQCSGVLYGLSV